MPDTNRDRTGDLPRCRSFALARCPAQWTSAVFPHEPAPLPMISGNVQRDINAAWERTE
jgi:hypothetical protein